MKGGALITAEIANAYSKDVFALPGNHNSEFSTGCNWLIKTNKANLITSVTDIEFIMNWSTERETTGSRMLLPDDLSPEELKIIQTLKLKSGPVTIDELTLKTLLNPSVLANYLLTLELKGLIKTLPGKSFKLV